MPKKEEFLLTTEGFLKLEEELNDLKTIERPKVIAALKDARAQGDLSENADYDAARNDQAKLEARIKELEKMIDNAVIIEEKKQKSGNVALGSTEVDLAQNKISNESPIGKAILGKSIGDIVSVESPNGSYDVKILSVS